MPELSPELVKRIKELKLEFKDKPQPNLLIPIPADNIGPEYEVMTETDEFTSLCPLNPSQPDYASLELRFIPDKYLVELKSLKMYWASYRMVPIFHEQIVPGMLVVLDNLIHPKWMRITGRFTIRGGLHTTVFAETGRGPDE